MGKKTPILLRSLWDFVTLTEEDQAMAINNMHKKRLCMLLWGYPHRHTHTDTLITILLNHSREQSNYATVIVGYNTIISMEILQHFTQ